jgi:RNA polymerase sigma factor FliA
MIDRLTSAVALLGPCRGRSPAEVAPLPLPTVTTAARTRYFEALGIDPAVRAGRQTVAVSAAYRTVSPVTSTNKSQKSSTSPHFKWLGSDGEWERLMQGLAPSTAHSSGGPQTLAGQVAEIDNQNQLDETWARYKDRAKQSDRDQLIVYYAPLVKYVAGRIAAGMPHNVDQADLVSYGMFGLIDAITKFDPERGFKFETYAISRIKGAVLDELRSIDWVPRSVRAKAKSVERAMSELESLHHRAPTDEEIAEELDLSMTQLNNIYNQISSLGVVALDEMLPFGNGDSMSFGDTLADRRDGPGGQYERVETRQLLGDAINRMGEREKIVLTLYYYESLTLSEIGNVLGVTESRVCQIHTKAVLQLRSRLQSAEREAV